jgi:putative ABC transport system substrate-binding protein
MRRALFALLLALLPLVGARAQEKPFRVVVLTQANSPAIERIFIPELARQGVVHGRNAAVETRVVAAELLPDAARELAAEAPAAIFAISPPVVAAVAAATKTVPVVMMASNDPVRAGWVASLARPGGNVTGMLILGSELDPKRLEVLKELVPGARRVALVRDPATISSERWRQMEAAAAKLDVAVEDVEAARRDDIAPAFQRARERGVDAVSVLTSPLYSTEAPTVAAAAIAVGLPTICHWREMAEAGCLASYGPTFAETFSIAAAQIARILRGANPAEMPVEQPTRLELVINGRTARALGLTLPPAVLAGADEVME